MARVQWNALPFLQEVERESANRMRDAVALATDYAKSNMMPMSPAPSGGFPGVDTGTLRRNITFRVEVEPQAVVGRFGVFETHDGGKPLDYAYWLEAGSRGKQWPWLTLTLDGTAGDVKRILGAR